jgi:hypothetical protein
VNNSGTRKAAAIIGYGADAGAYLVLFAWAGQRWLTILGITLAAIIALAILVFEPSKRARGLLGVPILIAAVVAALVAFNGSDTRVRIERVTATTDGIRIAEPTSDIPRCNAQISGSAPREGREEVWVAHRDLDSTDDYYYFVKAAWTDPDSDNWVMTSYIGTEDTGGHRVQFIPFLLDGRDSKLLWDLRILDTDSKEGDTFRSSMLPTGIKGDSPRVTATRRSAPSC